MKPLDLTLTAEQGATLAGLRAAWWVRVDLSADAVLLCLDSRRDGRQSTHAGAALGPLVEAAARGEPPRVYWPDKRPAGAPLTARPD